jgi:hypothetical protein
MVRLSFRKLRDKLSSSSNKSQNANASSNFSSQEDSTQLPASVNPPNMSETRLKEPPKPQDLWQAAYDRLDESERHVLLTTQVTAQPNSEENHPRMEIIIDGVIRKTEELYKEYQQGEDSQFRKPSQKIINAAWSFKDIIGAVAASDPTHHAASAWAIVSLGLTVCTNNKIYSRVTD